MAIKGLFTNIGIQKIREATNNEGFKIYPTGFAVSRIKGSLTQSRTDTNAGTWYQGLISGRIAVTTNTLKFICVIPQNATATTQIEYIREVYIFGKDTEDNDFLMVVGHTTNDTIYDPTGTVTLEIQISLLNVDLTNLIVFNNTIAQELESHRHDPHSHPDIIEAMNRGGLFLDAGGDAFRYAGQWFDQRVQFEGNKAFGTYESVTYESVYPTDEVITLEFDGELTGLEVVSIWNSDNPENPITVKTGDASTVMPEGTLELTGGSILVEEKDVVYKNTDGVYKRALADDPEKMHWVGFADIERRLVHGGGFLSYTHPFAVHDKVYLSPTEPGKITNIRSSALLGQVVDFNTLLIKPAGGGGGTNISSGYDAIVSDSITGEGVFTETQAAINFVDDNSSILIDKNEFIRNTLTTGGKRLKFYFSSEGNGWSYIANRQETQFIYFNPTPSSGTVHFVWESAFTPDLPYTASQSEISVALNAIMPEPVTVSGNFISGLEVTFSSYGTKELFEFPDDGRNDIQKISFSQVPNDGTFKINVGGSLTAPITFESDATVVQTKLSDIGVECTVTGSFAVGFTLEFVSSWGMQYVSPVEILGNTLLYGSINVSTSITHEQIGRHHSNNTGSAVVISRSIVGELAGDGTCITLSGNLNEFLNYGTITGFLNGIDLNGTIKNNIEMNFDSVENPIVGATYRGDSHEIKSYGVAKFKMATVGLHGDHATLESAVNAVPPGAKIVLLTDVTPTSPVTIDKDIEIEAQNCAKIHLSPASTPFVFEGAVKTKNLFFEYSGNGSDVLHFSRAKGHHLNLRVDLIGSTTLNSVFRLLDTSEAVFIEGVYTPNSAIINEKPLISESLVASSNIQIRGLTGGFQEEGERTFTITHQETPSGVIDGANTTFTLTGAILGDVSTTVFVNGLLQPPTEYSFVDENTLEFVNPPGIGKSITVLYQERVDSFVDAGFFGLEELQGTPNGVNKIFSSLEAGTLFPVLNGRLLHESEYTQVGSQIEFVEAPSVGTSVEAFRRESDPAPLHVVEKPSGLVNGVNARFRVSTPLLGDTGTFAYVDGVLISPSEFVIYGAYEIEFTTPPYPGQDVLVVYQLGELTNTVTVLNDGVQVSTEVLKLNFQSPFIVTSGGPAGVNISCPNVGGPNIYTPRLEERTLTASEIVNKELTLSYPIAGTTCLVDIVGGSTQQSGIDFLVSGNTISWNALGLEGNVAEGDTLRILFFSVN